MAGKSGLALTALSITLGLLFILVGVVKLTPALNEEIHKEMKTQFKRYRSVFPLYEVTGWRPKTSQYRKAVGVIELVCGLLLAFIPGPLKTVANVLLLCLMAGTIYTLWALQEELQFYSGSLIFGLLLTCRLVIQMQTRAAAAAEAREERRKKE